MMIRAVVSIECPECDKGAKINVQPTAWNREGLILALEMTKDMMAEQGCKHTIEGLAA